jgi:succinyl-CoA synthetase alpha subunit
MRAETLQDLLQGGDRVAVSNITGREASKVSLVSQRYCGNIVAGWALGKAGQVVDVPGTGSIPVYGQFDELMTSLPEKRRPNKIVVYSPPDAVYGDVKEVLEHGKKGVETIFVITENVSNEVTASCRWPRRRGYRGCNTLGVINPRTTSAWAQAATRRTRRSGRAQSASCPIPGTW